jgi:hypothetical protein
VKNGNAATISGPLPRDHGERDGHELCVASLAVVRHTRRRTDTRVPIALRASSRRTQAIAAAPDVGSVIWGSGGVRKVRWGVAGRGKRGGVRVVYYLKRHDEVWMLTLYAKNEAEGIPAHVLRQIKDEIDG